MTNDGIQKIFPFGNVYCEHGVYLGDANPYSPCSECSLPEGDPDLCNHIPGVNCCGDCECDR